MAYVKDSIRILTNLTGSSASFICGGKEIVIPAGTSIDLMDIVTLIDISDSPSLAALLSLGTSSFTINDGVTTYDLAGGLDLVSKTYADVSNETNLIPSYKISGNCDFTIIGYRDSCSNSSLYLDFERWGSYATYACPIPKAARLVGVSHISSYSSGTRYIRLRQGTNTLYQLAVTTNTGYTWDDAGLLTSIAAGTILNMYMGGYFDDPMVTMYFKFEV
jgi:hypothetical protein